MPYGVKTQRDERLWNKAKGRVKEEYPEVEEGSDRYWALVNGIYQRMRGRKGLQIAVKGWRGESQRHSEAAKRGWQKRARRSSRPPSYDRPVLDQTHKRWKLSFGRHLGVPSEEVLQALRAKPSSPRVYHLPADASPREHEVALRWAEGDYQAVADFYRKWKSDTERWAAAERAREEASRQSAARDAEQRRIWEEQKKQAQEAAKAEKRRQHAERVAAMSPEERKRYEEQKARRRQQDRRRRERDRVVRQWVRHYMVGAPDPRQRRYEYDTDRYIDDLAEYCGAAADRVVQAVEDQKLEPELAERILDGIFDEATKKETEDPYIYVRVRGAMIDAWERLTGEAQNTSAKDVAEELGMPVNSRTVARVVAGELTMDEARNIAARIKERHEQTDYDDLLRQGYSKEDARAWMQRRGPALKAMPDAHKALEGDVQRQAVNVSSRHDHTLPQDERDVKSGFLVVFKATHPEKRPRRGGLRQTKTGQVTTVRPHAAVQHIAQETLGGQGMLDFGPSSTTTPRPKTDVQLGREPDAQIDYGAPVPKIQIGNVTWSWRFYHRGGITPDDVDMEIEHRAVRAAVSAARDFFGSNDPLAKIIIAYDMGINTEYVPGGRTDYPVGLETIIVPDSKEAGRGTGGSDGTRGAAKVFWMPYSVPDRVGRYGEDFCESYGVDPIHVTVHELHHAFDYHTELDLGSEVAAWVAHCRLGCRYLPRDYVDEYDAWMLHALIGRGPEAAAYRAAVLWIYSRYPQQVEAAFARMPYAKPVSELREKLRRIKRRRLQTSPNFTMSKALSRDTLRRWEREVIASRPSSLRAQYPHKFVPSVFTRRGGIPLCLVCGQPQPAGDKCSGLGLWESRCEVLKAKTSDASLIGRAGILKGLPRFRRKANRPRPLWLVFRKTQAVTSVRAHPRRKPKGGVTAIPRYTRRVQRGKTVVYEYTEEHKQQAEQAKFERVQQLAQKLPQIIQDIDRELDKPDAPRDKVIAAIVMLIDRCYFRLGTEAYARKYQTYGVSTLRVEHVEVHGDQVRFRFPGKKRVLWDRVVTDPRLARLIEELVAGSPDGHLFWYNEGGNRVLIKGQDVNKWLRRYGDITAKDFRTYHATQLAYEGLQAVSRSAREKRLSPREAKQRVAKVVKDVAEQLGHTPAVCRRSYILPALIENFMKNGGRLTYRSWRP